MFYLRSGGVEFIEKVIKYMCSGCGDLFDTENECLEHENRHIRINAANEMIDSGFTLQEIQDFYHIWYSIPEHLKNVNKDNCFVILYWQCCNKPAYQIDYIYMDGRVRVCGCGSWRGYFCKPLNINDSDLQNVHGKEELFIDQRYINR